MSGKFTKEQVKEIQRLYREGWNVEYLSWQYLTAPGIIQNIISGNYEYNRDREALPLYKPFEQKT